MDLVSQNLLMTSGGKKDSTYVDDVFSTYLWRGDGNSGRAINNGIKLGNANAGNSVCFDDGNAGDYLQIAHTTNLCFGSGDFTIECWAYHIGDFDSYDALFGNWGSAGSFGYVLETVGSGATTDLEFYYYDDSNTFVGPVQGGQVTKNQWNHLCVCRSGNTIRVFVNGTMYGSGTSITTGIRDGSTEFTIGGQVAGSGWWNGYISNLRVTKGQALYTSNFTPSTQALTTTSQGATASNVKLLCCNKDTLTGATVTPSPIISDANYNGVPSIPVHSGFGPFTATDGEGGLVWMKSRSTGNVNVLFDTERGANQRLRSDSNLGQNNVDLLQPSFTNSGFTVGSGNEVNGSGNEYTSWTWRKQKGFFDVVTYTGNGTTQNIAHNLGTIPGCIMVKNTSASNDHWAVYHRDLDFPANDSKAYRLRLDENAGRATELQTWNYTDPTSTHFSVGQSSETNENGKTMVAYLFAGGGSTAATARAIRVTGGGVNNTSGNGYLTLASSSDFAYGTGDFTIEAWLRPDNSNADQVFLNHGSDNPMIGVINSKWQYYNSTVSHKYAGTPGVGQWSHFAVCRSSGTTRLFINGELKNSFSDTHNYGAQVTSIGAYHTGTYGWNGCISNVRIVKGTAVYTSSFNPPTEPLTNITNTKLLCCNSSSITGSTVTPGTITANGTINASTQQSPFDDPEGYKFGEGGDQNIIKCGCYKGTGSTGIEVNIGFEPQLILVKSLASGENWEIYDSMRGIVDGINQSDKRLRPNTNAAEDDNPGFFSLRPNGFIVDGTSGSVNSNGVTFIFLAIRRPDGLVGKPVEVGSDVFNMDVGSASSIIPNFYSKFPVDLSLIRKPASSASWWAGTRLTQGKEIKVNGTDVPVNWQYNVYDSNIGWQDYSGHNNSEMSWMWKRHAGFDIVNYKGDGSTFRNFNHSLGRTPEMMWVRGRGPNVANWYVYHTGMDNANRRNMYLETIDSQSSESTARWNDTFPTATHFTVGVNANYNGDSYVAMLFASVEGISSLGRYDGSNSNITITTGFSPRFILIKGYDANSYGRHWIVMDSVRGINPGSNTDYLYLENSAAQNNGGPEPYVSAISSTGFTLLGGKGDTTASNRKYIYYAHA